jgi:hypothetical protein
MDDYKKQEMLKFDAPKFQLGDDVMTKQIGLPVVGKVLGVMFGYYYSWANQAVNGQSLFLKWNELYPDWRTKCVYFILFNEPVRYMTYDEFCDNPTVQEEYKTRAHYEIMVKPVESVSHPEDDLELFTP